MAEVVEILINYGLVILAFAVFIEQVGLPVPAIPVLLAGGALAGAGKLNVLAVIIVAVVACFAGDAVWYEIGRRRGRQALGLLCRIAFEPDACVRKTESFYAVHGLRSLIVAKFIPGISTLAPALAGLFRVPLRSFALYNGLGAVVWVGSFVGVGYAVSHELEQIATEAAWLGQIMVAILGGGIVVYVAYKFIHRQLVLRELRMARITVDELKQLMDAEAPIVILDVRQAVADDEAPAIPGALRMSLEELDRRHQEIPRDHDVVVYCACPNEASAARMAILLRRHGIKRVRPLLGGIDAWVALRDVRARQASETETRAIA